MNHFMNLSIAVFPSLIPLTSNGIFAWRLRFQEDTRVLPTNKRQSLEAKVQALADKLKITKNLEIVEIRGLGNIAQAMGNTIFPGKAGIAIDPEAFAYMSEYTQEFILAHEISHIKHNDTLTLFLAQGFVGIITTLALAKLFPATAKISLKSFFSPASSLGMITGIAGLALFSHWREKQADKTAFSICSDQARYAAIKFFKEMQEGNLYDRNCDDDSQLTSLFVKILISPEGDNRLDFFHPSLQSRIDCLNDLIPT
ncbi:M48 family metallopeptidase [Parachlamydia acanthamoebae]|uniref:M48 family metallopeptidase n=1 Tax=Parachlamydia acanthamoebae TaxID=83552 RepID=UPI0024E215EC|nr:M48 family metalloprotease [Parachlamydia acanthamoebae]